jgi:hypothetical protein
LAIVKVAFTIERQAITRVDSLASQHGFPNSSGAIQSAPQAEFDRQEGVHFAAECAELYPGPEY